MLEHQVALGRVGSGDELGRWRCDATVSILRLGAVVIVPLFAYLGYRSFVDDALGLVSAHAVLLALFLAAAFWPRSSHLVRGGSLLLVLYWLAGIALYRRGSTGEAQALLLSAVLLAALLFGRVAGLAALVPNALLLIVVGFLQTGRGVESEAAGLSDSDVWLQVWVGKTLAVTVLGAALTFAVDNLVGRLHAALTESTLQVRQLEARDVLLTRETEELSQRHALLTRQSDALRAAVSVVLDLAPTLPEDVLLEGVTTLISEVCGLDHVGVFLVDPSGEWAELRASSSQGGRRMLSRRHRLRVGAEGIVGLVTAGGEPHVAPHVGDDPAYYQNPDLPETRSEIAVPIRNQGKVIGALDIQQTSPGAFSKGDIAAVQALADLVAAMYRNGRLFRQLQQSVAAERRAYAELSAQAWLERARVTEDIGYRYDRGRIHRFAGSEAEGKVDGGRPAPREQAWPLSIRGRFAGLVEAHKSAGQGDWTDAEREFMEMVIEQLGPALESARLHEDTQLRAARDRLLADVTARARETLDLDTVLRTAADEIYVALGLREVVVHLVPPPQEPVPAGERD